MMLFTAPGTSSSNCSTHRCCCSSALLLNLLPAPPPLSLSLLQPAHHVDSALSAAFPEANSSLKKKPGLDADLSGSTGIVAVISGNRLVAANLGDSRCVLGESQPHADCAAEGRGYQ